MVNEPMRLTEQVAQRLAAEAGLFFVVTPALSDEFDLVDGFRQTWQYIEKHRSYLPPAWWRNVHEPLPNALSWLLSRHIVVGGQATAWRLCLASRERGIVHRWPLPADGHSLSTSSLVAHLAVLAQERRRGRSSAH
jgi:hypothetical protein